MWKDRNFVVYLLVTLASKIGDKTYLIGMPWLVYNLTGSAIGMGIMFLMETLPYVFFSPLAGWLADRFSRKFLMGLTSTLQAVCIALVILLHILGMLRIEYVYLIGFFLSCAGATYMVLNDTVVPQLFREEMLARANAAVQFLDTSTLLLGTALAGVLISVLGVFGLFRLITAAYIAVALLTTLLRLHTDAPGEEEHNQEQSNLWLNLKQAFVYIVRHPIIGPLALLNLLGNIAGASITALLIYFLRSNLRLSSTQVGYIYGAAGVAEIVGVLLVPYFERERNSPIKIMLGCLFVFATGVLWTSFSWSMLTVAIGMMLQNIALVIYNVFSRTLRQKLVPAAMLGRVNGIFLTLSQTAFPLAGFLSAVFATFFGVQRVFSIVGIFTMIIAIVYWLSPFRRALPYKAIAHSEAAPIEQNIACRPSHSSALLPVYDETRQGKGRKS